MEDESAKLLVDGIGHARTPAWTPDGKGIVFAGVVRGVGEGIFLVDVTTGGVQPVWFGRSSWLAMSPDGVSIAIQPNPDALDAPIPILKVALPAS